MSVLTSLIAVLIATVAPGAAPAANPHGLGKVPGNTPVVLVVFDELPTATLMNKKGGINSQRFPGFASMARSSTWYPNHSTVADFTGRAVPAILTGTSPIVKTLPIASQQPHSIFEIFGGAYKFHVLEVATELCPRRLCPDEKRMARPLPRGLEAGTFVEAKFKPADPKENLQFVRTIPKKHRALTVLHAQLPHQPYRLMPSGKRYDASPISDVRGDDINYFGTGEPGIAMMLQRHYLQTGFADRLVSQMIHRLHKVGLWKHAMVIVTADHGATFEPGVPRRVATQAGLGGIANPPLFIKYPGQTKGKKSLRHTRSDDILPTIEQVLHIKPRFKTQGEPISEVGYTRKTAVNSATGAIITAPISKMLKQRKAIIKSSYKWLGSGGLNTLGPAPAMLGNRIGSARSSAGKVATLISPERYDVVRPKSKTIPAFVTGTLSGVDADSTILISVGRKVVATTRSFGFEGQTWFGAVVPQGSLKPGANKVGVFKLGPSGGLVRLWSN